MYQLTINRLHTIEPDGVCAHLAAAAAATRRVICVVAMIVLVVVAVLVDDGACVRVGMCARVHAFV